MPPCTVTDAEVKKALTIYDEAFTAVEARSERVRLDPSCLLQLRRSTSTCATSSTVPVRCASAPSTCPRPSSSAPAPRSCQRGHPAARSTCKLEGLHEGILVSAEIDTEATGECVRCLDPVSIPVQVEFQELFAYSADEAFDFAVRDDHVDLEPVVRDAVVLALPFQPVCRPDCPGLDPETGEKLADNPDRSPREVLDPRWAALEGFTPDSEKK